MIILLRTFEATGGDSARCVQCSEDLAGKPMMVGIFKYDDAGNKPHGFCLDPDKCLNPYINYVNEANETPSC